MDPVVSRLPTTLGSAAALVVAAISYATQVSPETCLMRAISAFVVFAAFGLVIRYLLADAPGMGAGQAGRGAGHGTLHDSSGAETIAPGTSVQDLLADEE